MDCQLMFYALFKSENLIGIFDTKEDIENMINGLKQNKFCYKNNLSIKRFIRNTIYEVKDNSKNNTEDTFEENKLVEISPEEEIERNKKKSNIDYELNKLKKDKDKINESKKTYKIDLDLYQKFKKIKNNDNQFEIPELFIEKYGVFEMIDADNNLNWENFYANYKHKNLSSSYGQMFDNSDAKQESINI
jgi:hypothetical protein